MKAAQHENIYDDLLYQLESQLKNTESEINNEKKVALMKIETIIETANSVSEIIKFEKQYDEVEKKYDQWCRANGTFRAFILRSRLMLLKSTS